MNEEELQELLSVYRHKQPMPALPRRFPVRGWWLAAAAAVIAVAVVIAAWPRREGWMVIDANGRRPIAAGETIDTRSGGSVRLESRDTGIVDLGPNSELRLVERNRFALAVGTIHAKTTSPPGIFIVDTPNARAIDLGCEYVLSISPSGDGVLRVSAGWVGLNNLAQTLVPQGAHAFIDADGRLSPPVFDDAAPAFQEAVRRTDLATVVTLARRRDALTLLNLFRFATPEERFRLYDRLNQLVPAPATIPREAMRSWNVRTTEAWWPAVIKASGVSAIKKKSRRTG